ncbi:hypothetical protein [Gaetbulibacter sp. PBL-D1]|uniref:hypothetical protein n=1 Tax=Gaetbulibacter sp. PBL-D1 TaxID=3422594 RepID=UPI003D2EA164
MKGYWNGEPATFVGVLYQVQEPEIKTWWQAQYVGTMRQGIEVTYGGETWIIDNKYGDGFYKVTQGMGSPNCAHKSVSNISDDHFTYIPDEDIITDLNKDMLAVEHESHQCYLREHFPEAFKRSQALIKSLKKTINQN